MANSNPDTGGLKPPWKSGQSGNPNGYNQFMGPDGPRMPLSERLNKRLEREADKVVDRLFDLLEKTIAIKSGDDTINAVVIGDQIKAIKEIWDRAEGKPKQTIDQTVTGTQTVYLNPNVIPPIDEPPAEDNGDAEAG